MNRFRSCTSFRLSVACSLALLPLGRWVQAAEGGGAPAPGKIRILVEEPAGRQRVGEPVQVGVPFAPGVLKEPTVRLLDPEGREVPCAATPTVRWARDGSLKWMLLDFQADAPASKTVAYTLEYGPQAKPAVPAEGIRTEEGPERISVKVPVQLPGGRKSVLSFSVAKKGGGRLESLKLGERSFVSAEAAHDLVWDCQTSPPGRTNEFRRGCWKIPEGENPQVFRSTARAGFQPGSPWPDKIGQYGNEYVAPGLFKVEIEEANAQRVVVRANGWYAGPGRDPQAVVPNCFYVVRYIAYAGKPWLRLEHTFVNALLPEAVAAICDKSFLKQYQLPEPKLADDSRMRKLPGQMFLRRLGFSLPVQGLKALIFGGGAAKGAPTPGAQGKFAGADDPGALLHPVELTPGLQAAWLLSAGPKIHHNGVTPESAKAKEESYQVFVQQAAGAGQAVGGAEGARSRGFVVAETGAGTVALCLRNFWRQHPNELQLDLKGGMLWAWLWADHGGMTLDNWNPRFGWYVPPPNDSRLAGQANGWSKTHEALLLLDERPAQEAVQEAEAAERRLNAPLWPAVEPAYACATGAAGVYGAVDREAFPGLERQVRISASMYRLHQEILHWNGFFDYGDHPYEFNQHGVRRSGGPPNTYCWTDYAGWALNDGNIAHHWWVCWFRSGDRLYRELAENLSRRINDETTSHWQCPDLSHDLQAGKGGGHRHDQSGFHGIVTGYGSDWLGAFDCFTMTGSRRASDWIRNGLYRWRRRGIWDQFGGEGPYALAYELFPSAENKMVPNADITSETEPRGLLQALRWNRASLFMGKNKAGPGGWEEYEGQPVPAKASYSFRGASQMLLPLEYAQQVCFRHPDPELAAWGERTTQDLLAIGKALSTNQTMEHHPARLFSWAYLQSGEELYLRNLFAALRSPAMLGPLKAAAAYAGDPLTEGWNITAVGGRTLPGGNVKQHWILWNVSCWPAAVAALKKAGLTEEEVLSGRAEKILEERAGAKKGPAP